MLLLVFAAPATWACDDWLAKTVAITGAVADQDALGGSGHLVVYPQAVGSWWDDRSAQAFDAAHSW